VAVVSDDFKVMKSLFHVFGAATEKVLTMCGILYHSGQTIRSNDRGCVWILYCHLKSHNLCLSTLLQVTQLY